MARWRRRIRCLRRCDCSREGAPELLFCENETNVRRLYGIDAAGYFKDGDQRLSWSRRRRARSTRRARAASAACCIGWTLPPGGSTAVRLRLRPADEAAAPFGDFDAVMAERIDEADEFYAALQRGIADPERAAGAAPGACRACSGPSSSTTSTFAQWLDGDPAAAAAAAGAAARPQRRLAHI